MTAEVCALTRLTLFAGPVKEDFRSTIVLGNLARDEAHALFLNYALPSITHLPPAETDTFARVYEVCGGNPGLLNKCATEVAAKGCWEEGMYCLAFSQPDATHIVFSRRLLCCCQLCYGTHHSRDDSFNVAGRCMERR